MATPETRTESKGSRSAQHTHENQEEGNEKSNKFQNDGSFMEMFKKKMAEQQMKAASSGSNSRTLRDDAVPHNDSTSPIVGRKEDKTTKPVNKPYQGITGKRKALVKSIELREKRKRRREELEEQQATESQDNKTSAWKSYLAEVKDYEERSCTDKDSSRRPLVK